MRTFGIFLFISLLALGSCKKKNPLERKMEGRVLDASSGAGVSGVNITLSAHVLVNGVYNVNPTILATAVSSGDGSYSLTFERQNADKYDLEMNSATIYQGTESIISDDMYSGNPFQHDIRVNAASSVEVHLKNNAAVPDSSDRVTYGYNGPELPCTCCTKDQIIKVGIVDTTFGCQTIANKWFVYSYSVKRKGQALTLTKDSVKCAVGKTTKIEILY